MMSQLLLLERSEFFFPKSLHAQRFTFSILFRGRNFRETLAWHSYINPDINVIMIARFFPLVCAKPLSETRPDLCH